MKLNRPPLLSNAPRESMALKDMEIRLIGECEVGQVSILRRFTLKPGNSNIWMHADTEDIEITRDDLSEDGVPWECLGQICYEAVPWHAPFGNLGGKLRRAQYALQVYLTGTSRAEVAITHFGFGSLQQSPRIQTAIEPSKHHLLNIYQDTIFEIITPQKSSIFQANFSSMSPRSSHVSSPTKGSLGIVPSTEEPAAKSGHATPIAEAGATETDGEVIKETPLTERQASLAQTSETASSVGIIHSTDLTALKHDAMSLDHNPKEASAELGSPEAVVDAMSVDQDIKSQSTKRSAEDDLDDEITPKKAKTASPVIRIPVTAKRGRGRPKKSLDAPSKSLDAPPSSVSSRSEVKRKASPKVTLVFTMSDIPDQTRAKKFLKSHTVIKDDVSESIDYLCVGSGKLSTTAKLLKAVALGKPILNDAWMTECIKSDALIDYKPFLLRDKDTEKLYGLPSTWSAGVEVDMQSFDNRSLYFTPALNKSLASNMKTIKELAKMMGFKKVASHGQKDLKKTDGWVCLGLASNDTDTVELMERDVTVCTKDLLYAMILKGTADVDSSTWAIDMSVKPEPKKGRGGRKKSG